MKKRGKKSNVAGGTKFFHDSVNKAIRDLWIINTTTMIQPDLILGRTLSKSTVQQQDLLALKRLRQRERTYRPVNKPIIPSAYQQQVAIHDAAIKRANTTLQPWPFVVIAIQTDGDKVWYDTVVYVTNKDYGCNTIEYIQLLDDIEWKCLENINDRYLISVGTFIFNDRMLDFDSMVEKMVDEMQLKGCLDTQICYLGMLEKCKEKDPELYQEFNRESSIKHLGYLIKAYYKRKI